MSVRWFYIWWSSTTMSGDSSPHEKGSSWNRGKILFYEQIQIPDLIDKFHLRGSLLPLFPRSLPGLAVRPLLWRGSTHKLAAVPFAVDSTALQLVQQQLTLLALAVVSIDNVDIVVDVVEQDNYFPSLVEESNTS